jgi:MFS family permease
MGYFIAIYTLASYCTDALGLSQTQGGAVQSILAAGQIIGRPLWGYLLDRGGRTNMVIVSYIICGIVTLAIWMPGRSFGLMALFGLLSGATSGTIHSASTPLAAAVVGVPDLASALSIYWLTLAIPNATGQAFAIMLADYSRSHLHRTGPQAYAISIGFCGGLNLAAACALFGVKHYLQGDWKIFKKS